MTLQTVRGTRDLLPGETEKWQAVEKIAHRVFSAYGYSELRTPIFEHTELFVRGVGEETDIVSKEMYTFKDRKERSITLRPEGTASVVRAYLEHHLGQGETGICKLYYLGPMFRYERPQAGRYRQFYQLGAEAIGFSQAEADAESIALLMTFLREVGLPGLSVNLNTVGCPECRPAYNKRLVEFLYGVEAQLSEESKVRLHKNPLRVLDSKLPQDVEATRRAPKLWDFLCSACSGHFAKVQRLLTDLDIPYQLNPHLVRGLDYYTRTAFEVQSESLGAQNAVAGGGRYDGLVSQFSNLSRPAVGFAIGLDRLMALLDQSQIPIPLAPKVQVLLAPLGEKAQRVLFKLLQALRIQGIKASMDLNGGKGLKAQLKQADAVGALFTVIVGDAELEKGSAGLKDMKAQTQSEVALDKLREELLARLKLFSSGASA